MLRFTQLGFGTKLWASSLCCPLVGILVWILAWNTVPVMLYTQKPCQFVLLMYTLDMANNPGVFTVLLPTVALGEFSQYSQLQSLSLDEVKWTIAT